MVRLTGGRPSFRQWVDSKTDPCWELMPLTHISTGIGAEDIIRAGHVAASHCQVFDEPLAYFFYGRPAYRIAADGAVKVEAACPYCFIFDAGLIRLSKAILPFDTGAFHSRLLEHILLKEMNVADFSLEQDERRPNRLIHAVFSNLENYLHGDTTKLAEPDVCANPWEFHAKSYLHLLASPGRNEPDDRICSIEVVFGSHVPLAAHLKAVVVPHTLWDATTTARRAPWLETLKENGVEIVPYPFIPGRHPEYYYAQLEAEVVQLYMRWNII
jgi:hypothetical protein